jgi:hypothetical protein
MDCTVKICANVCCVITALFDIRPGNPVPLLYKICIKTIGFVKHLDFIRWYKDVRESVPQLQYIFLNILHQVLAQLASFSTNLVNNNLIKHGDNGTKLTIVPVQKIIEYAARFFNCMDNHVLKGTFPNSVPKFTQRDANPRYQIANVIATMENRAALSISGDKKSKPDTSPPELPL